jgi:DNA-binding LytR/AlgR family response regulator
MRCVIVEDEPHSAKRLRSLLEDDTAIDVVGEAGDADAAVALIDELRPDLVFLDIRLPGATGFDVIRRCGHRPAVVFVTAYEEYALRAFDENAIDYLLKPVSRERLQKAVDRVQRRRTSLDSETLETLARMIQGRRRLVRFAVKHGDEVLVIPADEVYCFTARNKVVLLRTSDREFICDATLKELEASLDPERFCRIHKGSIVALDKIRRLQRAFLGEYVAELIDPRRTRLKVSRRYQPRLMEALNF